MFFNSVKEIISKKKVKKRFSSVKLVATDRLISKVGILLDEHFLTDVDEFVLYITRFGIPKEHIEVIVFKEKVNKNEFFQFPVYTYQDITWEGQLTKSEVLNFTKKPFDLLVSYYSEEKAPLLALTYESVALFKVGFSSIDKRLNHLMIDTAPENYKLFLDELFKYLRILKKTT